MFGTTCEGYIVLSDDVIVLKEFVIPVCIGVINIGVTAFALVNHHPRTFRVLGLVIASGPKFLHVLLGIEGVILAVGGIVEQVIQIYGVISPCLEFGGGRRLLPANAATVSHCRQAASLGSVLGSDEDHSE